MFAWAYIPVIGIGFDIAGAAIIAWSLSANSADKIAKNIPIHGMSFGLPHIALGSAVQRAEARLGIVLLTGGFLLQATAYFFAEPNESFETSRQRVVGLVLILVAWALSAAAYRLYVPWSSDRVYDSAQSRQHNPDKASS